MLAFCSDSGNPSDKIAFDTLGRNFIASPGEPRNFHLRSDPSVLVRPFYQLREGEKYFVYLHPKLTEWLKSFEIPKK